MIPRIDGSNYRLPRHHAQWRLDQWRRRCGAM